MGASPPSIPCNFHNQYFNAYDKVVGISGSPWINDSNGNPPLVSVAAVLAKTGQLECGNGCFWVSGTVLGVHAELLYLSRA